MGHYQPLNYKPFSPSYYLKTAFSDAIMATLYAHDEDYKRQKQDKRYRVGNDEEETTTSNPQSA